VDLAQGMLGAVPVPAQSPPAAPRRARPGDGRPRAGRPAGPPRAGREPRGVDPGHLRGGHRRAVPAALQREGLGVSAGDAGRRVDRRAGGHARPGAHPAERAGGPRRRGLGSEPDVPLPALRRHRRHLAGGGRAAGPGPAPVRHARRGPRPGGPPGPARRRPDRRLRSPGHLAPAGRAVRARPGPSGRGPARRLGPRAQRRARARRRPSRRLPGDPAGARLDLLPGAAQPLLPGHGVLELLAAQRAARRRLLVADGRGVRDAGEAGGRVAAPRCDRTACWAPARKS
jgi:hypothetical protein